MSASAERLTDLASWAVRMRDCGRAGFRKRMATTLEAVDHVLELRCALAMYAVDEAGVETGSQPATAALQGERCCDEWPECSHVVALMERVSAARASLGGVQQ